MDSFLSAFIPENELEPLTTVSPEILKAFDIRGIYPKPLGASQAELIGLAVGTIIKEEANRNIKVVIGRDIRNSSENLNKSLVHGLKITGLKIVDAGIVSSPLLCFASRVSGSALGVMITASHNPPEYNGFKFFLQGVPASAIWMEGFFSILKNQKFKKGAGVVEKKDFYPDYRNALVNTVAQNFQGLKIVVDPGNGSAALTVPKVLESLHCEVEVVNAKVDGLFPGRGADSSDPKTLQALGEKVKKSKARLGVAFDGDGDRASFVDEKGVEVPNDVILCLFAAHFLKRHKNLKVVYDGKCSDWVEKSVEAEGGTAILERSGHSFIYNRMLKEKALLGGEASGHFFLPGSFPGDALYACLRLLEVMKESRLSLYELRRPYPVRVSTHDVKFEIPADKTEQLYEALDDRAKDMGGKVSKIDGVRAVFEEGWGILRRSVTEPYVSCRLEAPTTAKLTSLVEGWFKDFPELQQLILKKIKEG
jgi:phosphomannomutase / phosphoglucomutase